MLMHPAGGPPAPRVTFWGAAQSVTGSLHRVEAAGRLLLLDCGLARGPRRTAPEPHPAFPFRPADVAAVVLSHAHVDHCGNLPNLFRQGFAGPVYCTPATRDLLGLVLADSARIHEEDARVQHVLGRPEGPTFTRADAAAVVRHCVAVPYDEPHRVLPDVGLRFSDAGHILGSAMTTLTFGDRTLTFTGDLGRPGWPLLRDPAPVPPADLLICESTYGGRTHDAVGRTAEALADIVRRSAARGGKVLIPSFSLGRMQVVVHTLQRLMRSGRLPELPVFVDSPLAADIAEVYRRHPDLLQAEPDFFDGGVVHYVRSFEESRSLHTRRESCVILAAGGMCDGGRIVNHLKHNLDDPRCTVVLVSYQAPHTLGRQLLEPRPAVRFHGRKWNLWADVVELNGFSGHAGHDELLAMLAPLAERVGKVRLVHGEPQAAAALAAALRERGFGDVAVPERGEVVGVG